MSSSLFICLCIIRGIQCLCQCAIRVLAIKAGLHVRRKHKHKHKKATYKSGRRKHNRKHERNNKKRKLFLFLALALMLMSLRLQCNPGLAQAQSQENRKARCFSLQAYFVKIFLTRFCLTLMQVIFYFIPEIKLSIAQPVLPHQVMKLAFLFPPKKDFPPSNPFWLLFYCSFTSYSPSSQ